MSTASLIMMIVVLGFYGIGFGVFVNKAFGRKSVE